MIPDWLMIVIAVTLAIVLVLLAILLAQKLSWNWDDKRYSYERTGYLTEVYVNQSDMWENIERKIELGYFVDEVEDFSGDLMGQRYIVTYGMKEIVTE